MGGRVLCCLTSFFHGWSQTMLIGNEKSSPWPLLYGVPQDSVFFLLLFNIYRKPVDEIICHHWMRCHQYVDDPQFSLGELSECCGCSFVVPVAVGVWIWNHKLQLNPGVMEWLQGGWGVLLCIQGFLSSWMGLHCLSQLGLLSEAPP